MKIRRLILDRKLKNRVCEDVFKNIQRCAYNRIDRMMVSVLRQTHQGIIYSEIMMTLRQLTPYED